MHKYICTCYSANQIFTKILQIYINSDMTIKRLENTRRAKKKKVLRIRGRKDREQDEE